MSTRFDKLFEETKRSLISEAVKKPALETGHFTDLFKDDELKDGGDMDVGGWIGCAFEEIGYRFATVDGAATELEIKFNGETGEVTLPQSLGEDEKALDAAWKDYDEAEEIRFLHKKYKLRGAIIYTVQGFLDLVNAACVVFYKAPKKQAAALWKSTFAEELALTEPNQHNYVKISGSVEDPAEKTGTLKLEFIERDGDDQSDDDEW